MRIIDRYILRQFLKTYLICYCSLTGLFVVFDALTNLDDFIKCAEKGQRLLVILATYYSYQSIYFFERTSGLLALMSAMFTVAWLQRHNEMTALMAAGVSRIRIVAPVIITAVVISLFATANRELIMPRFRAQLARRPADLLGDRGQELQPRYDNETEILLRGRATYADEGRIEKPDFLLPKPLHHYAKQLAAANAYYRRPSGNRPGGYLLDGMQQPKDLAARSSLISAGHAIVITPHDAPDWLKPNQCFLVSEVSFELLTGERAFRQFSSTRELVASLRNPSNDFGASVRVTIHQRILNSLLDMTLFFLGLPLVVARESRNVFVAIGLCIGVVTVFLLVVIGFEHLGSISLIHPAMAAWAPLVIFVPAAVGLAGSMWE